MKFSVFTFLLIIKIQRGHCQNPVQNPVEKPFQKPVQNPVQNSVQKPVQDHELQAVLTLSNQLHIALKNYISECNLVPVGNSCQKQTRQMNIAKGQDLVNIIVWNRNAGIEKILSRSITESNSLPKIEDLVIFVHDMGESSCSERMRKLIRDSYRKKPDNIVITIDYSPIVSFCSKSVH